MSWIVLQRAESYPVTVFPWTQTFESEKEARAAVKELCKRTEWPHGDKEDGSIWVDRGGLNVTYSFHKVFDSCSVPVNLLT